MLRVMLVRRTTSGVVGALLFGGLSMSCTADNPTGAATTATPGGPTTSVSTATAPAITLTRSDAPFEVRIRQLGDGVPGSERNQLRRAIGAPVSVWFDNAFLDVDYPADAFPGAFESWTRGSVPAATHDRPVTTNVSLGPDLLAVVARRRRAILFVFADNGVTGGATARVTLALTGEKRNGSLVHYGVRGDLYLTRDKGRWSIFGYDLQRTGGQS